MKKFNAFYNDKMKLYSEANQPTQTTPTQTGTTPVQTTSTATTTPVVPATAPVKPATKPATNTKTDIPDLVNKLINLNPNDLKQLQTSYAAALKTANQTPQPATQTPATIPPAQTTTTPVITQPAVK